MVDSQMHNDADYMQLALDEAGAAALVGDVPVGAVLVDDSTGEIVAKGRNTREYLQTATGHAEINAITDACAARGSWRLSSCTLYVTLEPCPMCAGAILHARIKRVVCATTDPVAGAMGSVWSVHEHPMHAHTCVEYGCKETEAKKLLQDFFRERRVRTENT